MFNLIGNALKFTFRGGITVRLNFINDTLLSEVEDSGIGIEENDLAQLFKFFGYIAKSKKINRGGMGLGLTISKMILQQLGGEISVSSIHNKVSVFKIKIPISYYLHSAL